MRASVHCYDKIATILQKSIRLTITLWGKANNLSDSLDGFVN